MLERAKGLVKKVTLEVVYEVVDERTKEILEVIKNIEKRQEEDFRYLNQKIDTQIGQVRNEIRQEIGQLRQETGQLRQEMTRMREEFKTDIHRLDEKIDRMNQRIDTVIQMLSEIIRSK